MPSKIRKRGENSFELCVTSGYGPDGKQILHRKTVIAHSPREVEKLYSLYVAEVAKGEAATSGKMNLIDFFTYWETNHAKKHHEAKTIVYNRGLFKRISTALGLMRIDHLQPKHLLKFYANLAEPGVSERGGSLSPNTIKKYHTFLHSLLKMAVQWQLIPFNPADKVTAPKASKTVKPIYDEATLARFLECLSGEALVHRCQIFISLATGLRRGELFGLEWGNVNFDNGTILIEQSSVTLSKSADDVQDLKQNGVFTKGTKTEGSRRLITVPLSVIDLLKQYKTAQTARRLELGDKWRPDVPIKEKTVETERVFTTWNGFAAHPDGMNTWLRKFTITNNLPHITPHTFRHIAATYMLDDGVDLRTVAGKLGHASTNTTTTVYSHLLKSAEEKTAGIMENRLINLKNIIIDKNKKQAK